jgi:23S rRNA pseudouridine2605 synthase
MTRPPSDSDDQRPSGIRLQKVLAGAGIASRRACDELIAAGRVGVNGRPARPGERVDPERDVVTLDGNRVALSSQLAYLALNKPAGVITAMTDRSGRDCVGDLVPAELRVNHVGRLDADTEGLLLLTNDGDLAHRLTHPSWEVPKRYLAEVTGRLSPTQLRALRQGVDLDDGPAAADRVELVQVQGGHSLVELTLHEGRNRIVRRMLDAVGHPVERLVRVAVGPIRLGELRPGRWRHLSRPETESLMRLVDM